MFEVKRYPLPQPLPVKVSGLKELSLPVEYNLDTRRVRFLSALENTLYTAFDPRNADQRYYLGEALSWNQPELVVNLVPEEAGFKLELHNPTGQPLTAELKGAPHFAPLAAFRWQGTLQPGEVRKVPVTPAPDSVGLVPSIY